SILNWKRKTSSKPWDMPPQVSNIMTQDFRAIYENGVLRPITPLVLPERAEVVGSLEQRVDGRGSRDSDPLLGLMGQEPDVLDQVIEEALSARERHPFRASN